MRLSNESTADCQYCAANIAFSSLITNDAKRISHFQAAFSNLERDTLESGATTSCRWVMRPVLISLLTSGPLGPRTYVCGVGNPMPERRPYKTWLGDLHIHRSYQIETTPAHCSTDKDIST